MTRKLLGEILVAQGILKKEQLEEALRIQRESGALLGEILISRGFVHPVALYEALAEQGNRLYAGKHLGELLASIDSDIVSRCDPTELLRLAFFPRRITNGTLEILTPFPENKAQDAWLERMFPGISVTKMFITPYELDWLLHFFFKERFLAEATTGLFFRSPEESAASVLVPWQWAVLCVVLFALLAGFFFAPQATLRTIFAIMNVALLAQVLFKTIAGIGGTVPVESVSVTEDDLASLDNHALPTYTVLLPLHREPKEVIEQLVASIRSLDYPQEKLDVLFLLEEDDTETIRACKEAHPPYNVRFILIPRGEPKTKPRACNFGLAFAKGEFLTIYDAEDIPEKDQLKKAVIAFSKLPKEYICLQAALNFYNPTQNILTRLFTLEYSFWFDYLLPGLFRLRLPIPLGGTSNHFKTEALRAMGGWDPFNVTEDADLGMRAHYRGLRVGILASTTYEEANSRLRNWIRQRSRWLKGYLMTFLVHTRRPLRVLRVSGIRGLLTLWLFIGGTPLGYAASLILWGVFFSWLLTRSAAFDLLFSRAFLCIGAVNLFVGNLLGVYFSMFAVFRRNLDPLLPFAFLNPFYWMLAGVAAWKGIGQLLSQPFFWEKTVHGLHKRKEQ
ncbi:MAG: glycosyltransferase [Candidatus Caldatribacterium sp.]|nr:glycosyltransferase [Candidatus Caldatribacterium sp.]